MLAFRHEKICVLSKFLEMELLGQGIFGCVILIYITRLPS